MQAQILHQIVGLTLIDKLNLNLKATNLFSKANEPILKANIILILSYATSIGANPNW